MDDDWQNKIVFRNLFSIRNELIIIILIIAIYKQLI